MTTTLVADCISQKNRESVSEQAALAQLTRGAQLALHNPRVPHASLLKTGALAARSPGLYTV